MPSYIVCKDIIRDIDEQCAKQYNLPIVLIKTNIISQMMYSDIYEPYSKRRGLLGGNLKEYHTEL